MPEYSEAESAARDRVVEAARHARDEGWIVSPSISRALDELDGVLFDAPREPRTPNAPAGTEAFDLPNELRSIATGVTGLENRE